MTDDELERIKIRKLAEMMVRTTKMSGPIGPVVLSDSDFDEFVSAHPVALVDFWAEWCGPCRIIGPVVDQLARDYAGRLAVGKLNVDHNPRTSSRFGVTSIPRLLIFKNGRLADGIVGAVPRNMIESRLAKHLS